MCGFLCFQKQQHRHAPQVQTQLSAGSDSEVGGAKSELARSKSVRRERLAAYSTAMEAIQADQDLADAEQDEEENDLPYVNQHFTSYSFYKCN